MSRWKIVKLELAQTDGFPRGSPSRSYLLHLPLREDGSIDETVRAADPGNATVRRFWPSEPDQYGYVLRRRGGWAFSFAISANDDDEGSCHMEDNPIIVGDVLSLEDQTAGRSPFRIVSIAVG